MTPTIEQIWITPELATSWLAKHNTKNRPISKSHVTRLANEMSAGRWQFNGDTFCFNGDELVDGQHRLSAIVKSGMTIPAIVIRGLQSDSFYTKNVGAKSRTSGDVLAIKNVPNYNRVAAASRIVIAYDRGDSVDKAHTTAREVAEFCDSNPGIVQSGQFVGGIPAFRPIGHSLLAACHFMFGRVDQEQADSFIYNTCVGEMLEANSPILHLRNRMQAEFNASMRSHVQNSWRLAMTIKAWNFWRLGQPIKRLTISPKEDIQQII